MSDNHNRKDSIEQLFREKAEDYQINFKEEDWLKLEKRLDLQKKEYAARRRRRWMVAASIIILSLLGYFTYQNYVNINEINRQLSEDNVPEAQQQENQSETDSSPNQSNSEESIDAGDPNSESGQENGDRSGSSNLAEQSSDEPPATPNYETGEAGQGDRYSNEFLATGQTGDELSISELACSTCSLAPATDENQFRTLSDARITGQTTDNTVFAASNASSRDITSDKTRRTSSRVSLGLVLSPDLSTVGSVSNFYEPGYKFGAIIEYKLSSDLQISAGIIQSDVRYQAQGGEYKPPSGYWTYGVVPEETTGECLLIDIPINVKYNFLHFDRSRIYATTGISSYIMLDEKYRFTYDGNDSGLVQGWSGQTGTRHWISNLGFSVGYELDLHSSWSVRAEPFIKVPLKEVGWGNVKLYSIGSFISINYKL